MAWSKSEFDQKLARLRSFMAQENVANLLITGQTNFWWLTGGRPFVNQAVEKACADLLVTADKVYLVANNIEADRLLTEELSGLPLEKAVYSWWEAAGAQSMVREITGGAPVVTEGEVAAKLARLRWNLLPEERVRFADAAKSAATVVEELAYAIKPGMSELEISALMKEKAAAAGVSAFVSLVAADERAYQYRHPLPTAKKVQKYVMLVISGQKHGLYASVTRLVHFGPVPADLRARHQAVANVDAAFIGATRPGAKVSDIFAAGCQAYADMGFAGEWQYHHQGGLAGYNSRELRASADCAEIVASGQVYAWNPTIAGVKSEDTILVAEDGPVVLTATGKYPVIQAEYRGFRLERPAILER